MQWTLRIYETGEYKFTGPVGGKMKIMAIDGWMLVVKQNGFSGYVHRGVGVQYTPPQIQIFEIISKKSYKFKGEHFVEMQIEEKHNFDVPKDFIQNLVKTELQYRPAMQYDPLAKYSPKEREQIEAMMKRQQEREDEIISKSQNFKKD